MTVKKRSNYKCFFIGRTSTSKDIDFQCNCAIKETSFLKCGRLRQVDDYYARKTTRFVLLVKLGNTASNLKKHRWCSLHKDDQLLKTKPHYEHDNEKRTTNFEINTISDPAGIRSTTSDVKKSRDRQSNGIRVGRSSANFT